MSLEERGKGVLGSMFQIQRFDSFRTLNLELEHAPMVAALMLNPEKSRPFVARAAKPF